jgi:hypothetical protein
VKITIETKSGEKKVYESLFDVGEKVFKDSCTDFDVSNILVIEHVFLKNGVFSFFVDGEKLNHSEEVLELHLISLKSALQIVERKKALIQKEIEAQIQQPGLAVEHTIQCA